jgi:hypothetical protein
LYAKPTIARHVVSSFSGCARLSLAMDPVSAFSLAGTILQFIDSGSKFIGIAWRFYRRSPGSSDELSELAVLTQHLTDVLGSLKSSASSHNESGGNHSAISDLADDCKATGNQLLALLTKLLKLPSDKDKKPRKRDAVKVAFRTLWGEDDIRSLQSRLDGFRAQFNVSLLVSLR